MNKQPIETAQDQDLRLSLQAMQRAAKRAREIAAQTGTDIVISHHGVIEQISPGAESTDSQVHEPTPPYGDK
ncbi:hypothetical protein [Sedimenticola hydrogenitrophicus]|uniref:hypothetical protein n=1 Tax=Sedimenticola hydrogenitrophicus TaxID=2967975 RepID=UPI0023B13F14|nr:hypothetical protein [Sedimenticola hydrogenitrophicus]